MDNFDISSGFTNTFATDSKDSSIKADTNAIETFSTNPSFNVTTTDLADQVASKLMLDQNKQTTVCHENAASSETNAPDGNQNLDCSPPDIQITPVATVDQNASDYEPEEMDPHPTPAGVITPEDEEGTSTPTENLDLPTDDAVEPILTQHSTESDTVAGSVAELPPESENVNHIEKERPKSIEGNSNFVMTENKPPLPTLSKSESFTEKKESVSSVGPMVRPSIELDESSTEHEYHVSPSNENVGSKV